MYSLSKIEFIVSDFSAITEVPCGEHVICVIAEISFCAVIQSRGSSTNNKNLNYFICKERVTQQVFLYMCSPIEIQSVKAHSESGWYPCRVHLLLAQQTESNSGCDPHSISQDSRKCPKLVYLSVARSSLRFAKKELCHLKIVFFVSIDVLYLYICNMLLFVS